MPGIFDIKNKTLDELKQEADSYFEKQTGGFDKFWYFLNVTALEKSVADAKEKLKEPDSTDLDKEYTDPEEERKALEKVKNDEPERFFSNEERERLTVPGDENADDKAFDLNQYVEEKLDDEVFNPVTLNDLKNCYQMQGMMMAKIAIEMQKEYEEKLKLIPENDPHRKEKAEFLQMNDTHSKVMSMDNSLKNYIAHFNMKNNTLTENMLDDSPIPDVEAMKKLSMKAFLDDTMTSPEDQKKFFEERKNWG